jgi:hypothetical protein
VEFVFNSLQLFLEKEVPKDALFTRLDWLIVRISVSFCTVSGVTASLMEVLERKKINLLSKNFPNFICASHNLQQWSCVLDILELDVTIYGCLKTPKLTSGHANTHCFFRFVLCWCIDVKLTQRTIAKQLQSNWVTITWKLRLICSVLPTPYSELAMSTH